MQYRDVKLSIRMFLDDFIQEPFRDYVVYYLQKVEQTCKVKVHHVFIYYDVKKIKVNGHTLRTTKMLQIYSQD